MKDTSCLNCKNFDFKSGESCKAFPKRIPFAIMSGQADHRKEFPGDSGIRFVPMRNDEVKP